MKIKIVEIKAKHQSPTSVEKLLKELGAKYIGTDHQIDTYFKVPNGRLKLREGNIENHLIHYYRSNQSEAKLSSVALYKTNPKASLKEILTNAIGVLTIVDKERKIFFIDNVKFHIDLVKDLGEFIEIEAIDETETVAENILREQCLYYQQLFEVNENDLIAVSYSDLLLQKSN